MYSPMRSLAWREMTGGTTVKGSSGGPTGRLATASRRRWRNSPYALPTTTTRLAALHFCPAYPKAECTTPPTARSRSASSSTITAFFPPSSAMSFFGPGCPSRTSAAAAAIENPVSVPPVNAIISTPGCSTSRRPVSAPGPGRQWRTPAGTPAFQRIRASPVAMIGDSSAGLSSTAFPPARAAPVIPPMMASGKFHGPITATTPRPSRRRRFVSPGTVVRSAASPSRSASSA